MSGPEMPGPDEEEGEFLPPAETLALVEQQRAAANDELSLDWRLIYGVWGSAFLFGFGGLYLQRTALDSVPAVVAGLVLFALILMALTVTATHTSRVTRGLRGVSATANSMLGWTYLLGFGGALTITLALFRAGAPESVTALSLPALSLLVVGLVYMTSAALERARLQFLLGAWIVFTDTTAMLTGMPTAYLVLSLAGGGGFLVGAGLHILFRRRGHKPQ
ncbi:hypothetical protein [Nocardiopsis sp. NPDC006832]|uniref:hypothetical protein n=1 Tax=Nocardiopsis sp. NPDC006832 TaxID=3157188 RepID=UPI0033C1315D